LSTSYPLINKVTWGTGGTLVAVDQVSGALGLSAAVVPARAPVEVYDGAGDLHLIYGPGADRVRVTITGSGRGVPSLTGQTLGALVTVIYWPNGTTTTLTLVSAGTIERTTDLAGAVTGWKWEGVGLVTAGADPLGR